MARNSNILLEIVQGLRPLQGLSEAGIKITDTPGGIAAIEPAVRETVRPSAGDFVMGFLAYRETPSEMEHWAAALLAVNRLDLGALEDAPDGELLLNALWDAAAGGMPTDDFYDRVVRIRRG